ncbi:MAG TPA: SRPBCC domain-containing protein [Methylophilus sp.]
MTVFSTQRWFAVSQAVLFAAFSQAEYLARWWGPAGFTNQFEQFDFRAGGDWRFTMIGPDGVHYPNQSRFVYIHAPSRIVIRHLNLPYFDLTVTLEPHAQGTWLYWQQAFADDQVAAAVCAIVEPANEQNLDRLQQVLVQMGAADAAGESMA